MSATSLLYLFISIGVLTIKPGPGMVAMVTRALSDGFFPAFAIALGIASMHLFYFPLAAYSFSLEGELVERVTFAMQMIGALYILYMGAKGLRNSNRNPWDQRRSENRNKQLVENYMTGLAINLSNPYVILFYVGLIPSIFDFDSLTMVDIGVATVTTFCIIVVFLAMECALAAQFREILKDYNMVRVLNIVASLAMIGIGIFVVIHALNLAQASLG